MNAIRYFADSLIEQQATHCPIGCDDDTEFKTL